MTESAGVLAEPATPGTRGILRWWLDRPVLVKGLIVVAIPMLALIVVAGAGLTAQLQERQERQVAASASALTSGARVVLADTVDAESGVRGYASTADPQFLVPYTASVARIDKDMKILLQAAAAQGVRSQADAAAVTVKQKFGQLADLHAAVRAGDTGAALVPEMSAGKIVTDRLRAQMETVVDGPTKLIAEKRASINRLQTIIETIQVSGLVLGLLAGVAGIALFATGISRRIRVAAENSSRLGRGEPLWPATRSADEIGQLGVSLVEARQLLESRLAELSAARDQALKATKAKNTFLSRTSHELRTPLHAVLGFAQLLEMSGLNSDDRGSAARISAAGQHLLTLINELIDTALIESGELRLSVEPVSIHGICDDIANLITPLAAARDITVERHFTNPRLAAYADDQRLRQIMVNLASNAVKYNHDGGAITIGYGTDGSGMVELRVTDTGPGLTPDQIERVFVPFERLNAEQHGIEGSGIGLPLALALTEALHGLIDVTSIPGQGATFTVRLPRATDIAATGRQWQSAGPSSPAGDDIGLVAEPHPGHRLSVLSIEDNAANNQMLVRIFQKWPDTDLYSASRATDGFELALRHRPDLILLDLHLPDMPGEEVFARFRAEPHTAQTPIIVLSADATPGTIRRLLARGAAYYLTKPMDIAELRRIIDETMDSRVVTIGSRSME